MQSSKNQKVLHETKQTKTRKYKDHVIFFFPYGIQQSGSSQSVMEGII